MYVTGLQSREPVKIGAHVIQFHAGHHERSALDDRAPGHGGERSG